MTEEAKQTGEAAAGRPWHRVAGSKVWYFFNSLKLTIFVLIILASVSIIGTVIEQNKPVEAYLSDYGERWTGAILYTGMNDMYHSWWFTALLSALTLNIIVCTLERFPPKWKSLLAHKPDGFDPRLIDRLQHSMTLTVDGAPAEARLKVLKALKGKRFKTIESEAAGGHNIYAWKGIIGRFGSDATHVSLLLILLGAIIGSFAGYKDFMGVYVGGSVVVPQADFSLRLDKFWIDHYETGQVKQYHSILTVVEQGRDVLTKEIWVNEPLYYKGIRFYQSSYGTAWDRIEEAELSLKKKGSEGPGATVVAKWGETVQIPGTRYSVMINGYSADFAFDERTKTVFSKSGDPNNPAVRVEVYDGQRLVSAPWLFFNYPGIFPSIPGSDDDLAFVGYRGTVYSGISVNKDPGTNIVWVGTGVMGLGFMLAFFVYHRRVWVHIKDTGASSEVKLGGTINKNSLVFEREMKEIADALSSRQ